MKILESDRNLLCLFCINDSRASIFAASLVQVPIYIFTILYACCFSWTQDKGNLMIPKDFSFAIDHNDISFKIRFSSKLILIFEVIILFLFILPIYSVSIIPISFFHRFKAFEGYNLAFLVSPVIFHQITVYGISFNLCRRFRSRKKQVCASAL